MLEETEEALPLTAILINQNIVRQMQVASTGQSRESQTEKILFYWHWVIFPFLGSLGQG